MKRSKYLLALMIAGLAVTSAGCGSSDSSGSSTASKADTSSAAVTDTASQADSASDVSSAAPAESSEAPAESSEAPAESAAESVTEDSTPQTDPSASNSNTTYNVGEFSVFVPEGWQAIPVPDHTDSSKTATNDILLAKGAEYKEATGSWDYESGPYFYITLLNKDDFAKASTGRDYYVEQFGSVKDMEDMKTGSLTWHGFSVNPIGADVYMIWAEKGEGGFYSSISTAYDLSLQDEDVQAILGSLA